MNDQSKKGALLGDGRCRRIEMIVCMLLIGAADAFIPNSVPIQFVITLAQNL